MKEGSENSGIGRENAEFQRLLAAHPRKTPTGKAVRQIWFEYFFEKMPKEWCCIFESGRIWEETGEIL